MAPAPLEEPYPLPVQAFSSPGWPGGTCAASEAPGDLGFSCALCTESLPRPQELSAGSPPLSAKAGIAMANIMAAITNATTTNEMMRLISVTSFRKGAGLVSPAMLHNETKYEGLTSAGATSENTSFRQHEVLGTLLQRTIFGELPRMHLQVVG